MISSLDHAVDLVVQSLKENNFYENTIIVFTTDNGGAVMMGGNNWPLRGTKGTVFEVDGRVYIEELDFENLLD